MPRINSHENVARAQKSSANSPASGSEIAAHKRALSANPRTQSMRSAEERERWADKHTATMREAMLSQTKSPDRRNAPPLVPKSQSRAMIDNRKSAETRLKEARQEVPPQGMSAQTSYAQSGVDYSTHANVGCNNSSMGTRSDPVTSYICTTGVSNIDSSISLTSRIDTSAKTISRAVCGSARESYCGRPFVRLYGL